MKIRSAIALVSGVIGLAGAPAMANPITYEIGVTVTNYRFYDPLLDPVPPTMQIGDTAQFRVLFDTEAPTTAPSWRLDSADQQFYVRLVGINLDGVWVDTDIVGAGVDYARFGTEFDGGIFCGYHSVYGCSAMDFGQYMLFSNWGIDYWVDPSSETGLHTSPYPTSDPRYFFCNITECEFGGTGRFTSIRSVPEPSTLALLGLGLVGLGFTRRRKLN